MSVICTLTIMALRDASTDIYTVSQICKKDNYRKLLMVLHQQKLLIFEGIIRTCPNLNLIFSKLISFNQCSEHCIKLKVY